MCKPMPDEPIPEETHAQVNAGVARAGGIMVFSLLMSRVLGIVRDMIITQQVADAVNQEPLHALLKSYPELVGVSLHIFKRYNKIA